MVAPRLRRGRGRRPPAVGSVSRQHFKGRLPYHLRTTSTIVRLERPRVVEADVVGDLSGTGVWTLTPTDEGGTHVRFDWRVDADRPLLRTLTPTGRPAGSTRIAVDRAGAGEGDCVLVVDEGNSARQIFGDPRGAVKTVIVGVVDYVEQEDQIVYDARQGSSRARAREVRA